MSREIKFRGKKTTTGKWKYGYYVQHQKVMPTPLGWTKDDAEHNTEHYIVFDDFANWNMPRQLLMAKVDSKTVGQYTGMKDCNGKEIYDGDIVRTNYDDVGIVTMGEHNGVSSSEAFNIGFYIIWDSSDDRSWMRNELLYFIKKIGITVIGNRWDNPKLLKGASDGNWID